MGTSLVRDSDTSVFHSSMPVAFEFKAANDTLQPARRTVPQTQRMAAGIVQTLAGAGRLWLFCEWQIP
jgi:hypothetical protein